MDSIHAPCHLSIGIRKYDYRRKRYENEGFLKNLRNEFEAFLNKIFHLLQFFFYSLNEISTKMFITTDLRFQINFFLLCVLFSEKFGFLAEIGVFLTRNSLLTYTGRAVLSNFWDFLICRNMFSMV